MEAAVIGRRARTICKGIFPAVYSFPAASAIAARRWDLLVLLPDASLALPRPLRAGTLLLPGGSDVTRLRGAQASQLVGYGFSPRDTLTLSSLTGQEPLICLQRSLLTLTGRLIEPQELPLPGALRELGAVEALPLAGLWLLLS